MKKLFLLFVGIIPLFCFGQLPAPVLELVQVASGLNRPIGISNAGDDRLFIMEQDGTIRIINGSGTVLPTPFLDINSIVNSGGDEQGLLGLAFHPDYASNGFLFVNYINNSSDTRVSRFSVNPVDSNQVMTGSEVILMTIDQPFSNHNGGDIHFGPDGYLYIATGDGGSGGDPGNRAQNPTNLLGKMLRIDVDSGSPYGIPPDNPFVNDPGTSNEIWALGLRNPWRFSFDRLTNDMFIGDVGQGAWEEIDFQPASSPGGENYGWRCYEGNNTFNTSGCGPVGNYTFPIYEYVSNFPTGCSITGGYVYRGSDYPNMEGKYFYVDYCAGNFWYLEPDGMGGWSNNFLLNGVNFEFTAFGEDQNGELFVATRDLGIIYQLTDVCTGFEVTATVDQETCAGDSDGGVDLLIEGGNGAIEVVWSNGPEVEDQVNLPSGVYTATITDANSCTIIQTVEITNSSPLPPVIAVDGPTNVCFGETVTLTATAPPLGSMVQWFNMETMIPGANQTTLVLDEVDSGMYNAFYIGGPCPSGVSNIVEVNILPVPDVPVIGQNGNTLIAPASAGYQWYLEGVAIEGATSQNYTAEATGEYTLEVFNAANCSTLSDPLNLLSLSASTPSEFVNWSITPTPFRNDIHLQIELITRTQIEFRVTDVSGRVVFEADFGEVGFVDRFVNLSGLPAGIFFAEIKTDSGWVVRKLVKQE